MPSLFNKRENQLSQLQQLPPSEEDPHADWPGVLLSDEIEFYAEHCKLIVPFNRDNLKPAAYELTVGDEYFLNGEYRSLDAAANGDSIIRIPPFEVAVLKTAEILCLPRYIIGRWNIKVKHAYSGLLWVGGPQVDPGWVGNLFCPIYNLSDKPVALHVGDQIAVMDFVKTTPYDKTKSTKELLRYLYPPNRRIIEDYQIDDLRSALFTNASQKLVEFEEEIRNMTARFQTFTSLSFLIFALMISALAIIPKGNAENLALGTAIWGSLNFALSVFAVLIVLFSNVQRRVGPLVYELYGRLMGDRASIAMRFLRRRWWAGLMISIVLSAGAGAGLYAVIEPNFRNLRGQLVLTKSDLEPVTGSLSRDLHQLSERLTRLEQSRIATADDLQRMKVDLEHQIASMRSNTK